MKTIIYDIETVGYPLESFDEKQIEYLLKPVEKEETDFKKTEKREEIIRSLNLSPLTAQVVAIGLYNQESDKFLVLFQSDKTDNYELEGGRYKFISGTEKEILEKFWKVIKDANKLVTFNGRGFDAPFLHIRSAILRIKPTKNLIPYRFDSKFHCDLLEQFTYYGLTRKYNLDFYCKAFGIESPKEGEVTGYNMNEVFAQKRYREIAEYCAKDLYSTFELYKIFEEFVDTNNL